MQSIHSIARNHRARKPGEYKSGATARKVKPEKKKKRIVNRAHYARPTEGDWKAENLSVVVDEVTIATADLRRVLPETATQNIRLMAKAPKLFDIVSRLASANPGDFETLVAKAKEVVGATQ